MGIFADKITPIVGRLGVFVASLTRCRARLCGAAVHCRDWTDAQAIFITLIVIWSITSSVLRAPR